MLLPCYYVECDAGCGDYINLGRCGLVLLFYCHTCSVRVPLALSKYSTVDNAT